VLFVCLREVCCWIGDYLLLLKEFRSKVFLVVQQLCRICPLSQVYVIYITLQDVSLFPFSCGVVIVLVRIVCCNLFIRMVAVICIKSETFGILNLLGGKCNF
jgi:hypothetical protein